MTSSNTICICDINTCKKTDTCTYTYAYAYTYTYTYTYTCTHDKAVDFIDAVKELGFYPKETKATDDDSNKEYNLAWKIRQARKKQLFTPTHTHTHTHRLG